MFQAVKSYESAGFVSECVGGGDVDDDVDESA